ncbi:MAG TPA: acyltransferase [Planctomycetota bacterium]|nr:acyltransferase [Planctomycetota bacterium]
MERIRGFDGLRALAATSVVLTHLGLLRWLGKSPLRTMVEGGPAVQLFFALSGFLITALLVRERQAFGRVSVKYFYARRACRIFPPYFVLLGAVAALHFALAYVSKREGLVAAAVYLYNFQPWRHWDPFLGHLWSLAVEEHFYLLWPVTFAVLYPRRKRALVTGSLLVCLFAVLVQLRLPPWFARDYVPHRWTCFAGTSILLGCVAAVLSCDTEYAPRWGPLLRSRGALLLAALLWANGFVVPAEMPLAYHLRGAGFALLVAWIYGNQGGRAARALEVAPLRYVGTISYGVYLYHGLFVTTGPERVAGHAWPPARWLGVLLLAVAAPVSYRFFESRFIRLGKRFRQREKVVVRERELVGAG